MVPRSLAILVVALVLLGLTPAGVRADAIAPGQKGISHCFTIGNLEAFPGYVVLAYFTPQGSGYAQVHAGECLPSQRGAILYAMRAGDFQQARIPAAGDAAGTFFRTDPRVIRASDPQQARVTAYRTRDSNDPVTAIADILAIATLDDQGFAVRNASARFTFADGTTREVPYQQQGALPAPGAAPAAARSFALAWFALLPLAALLGIGAASVLRRRRR